MSVNLMPLPSQMPACHHEILFLPLIHYIRSPPYSLTYQLTQEVELISQSL